jgi:hypothetical protein
MEARPRDPQRERLRGVRLGGGTTAHADETHADGPHKDGEGRGENEPININNDSEQSRLPQPTERIFSRWQRELFKTILKEVNLKVDREGQPPKVR